MIVGMIGLENTIYSICRQNIYIDLWLCLIYFMFSDQNHGILVDKKKVVDGYPSDEVGVPSDNVWLLKNCRHMEVS